MNPGKLCALKAIELLQKFDFWIRTDMVRNLYYPCRPHIDLEGAIWRAALALSKSNKPTQSAYYINLAGYFYQKENASPLDNWSLRSIKRIYREKEAKALLLEAAESIGQSDEYCAVRLEGRLNPIFLKKEELSQPIVLDKKGIPVGGINLSSRKENYELQDN